MPGRIVGFTLSRHGKNLKIDFSCGNTMLLHYCKSHHVNCFSSSVFKGVFNGYHSVHYVEYIYYLACIIQAQVILCILHQ